MFKWSVLAGLYKPTDPSIFCRVSSYTAQQTREDVPDFSMLKYPVSLANISTFEIANDISLNVYTVNEKNVKKSKKKPVEEVNDGQLPSEYEHPSECESDTSDKGPPTKKRRCHFLDDEASGSDSDEEEGDLDGCIDKNYMRVPCSTTQYTKGVTVKR